MRRIALRRRKIIIPAAVTMAAAAWVAWSNVSPEVTELTVESEKLPESFSGFRIAQISDLHNAEFGSGNMKLVSLLEGAAPDIIVITGDIADSRSTRIDICLAFAEKCVQIAPTFYVTGNHEARIDEYPELAAGLEEAGVTVLDNSSAAVERGGESISVIGVRDPAFTAGRASSTVASALASLTGGDGYKILLSHRPELFSTYVASGVDLVLAGHAHGGQVRLPVIGGLFAPGQGFFPEYDSGLYTSGTTRMIVSRGLGSSSFPVRINDRPEIVVAELISK